MMGNICLGPYKISSPHVKNVGDGTFINKFKSKLVVVITDKGVNNPPCDDAILLHEFLGDDHDMRWYECPSQMGRTYSILADACEVAITPFENGFMSKGTCDAKLYGCEFFCFGKNYLNDKENDNDGQCKTTIEFDGHTFIVEGISSVNTGLYDCTKCFDEEELFDNDSVNRTYSDTFNASDSKNVEQFGDQPPSPNPAKWDLPIGAPYATGMRSISMIAEQAFDASGVQYDFDCISDPSKSSGWIDSRQYSLSGLDPDTTYSFRVRYRDKSDNLNETEWSVVQSVTTFGSEGSSDGSIAMEKCESQDNPHIDIRPSGSAIVAYEKRSRNGNTQIRLHQEPTSQSQKIVYYRSLSRGRLINNLDDITPGRAQLEIYDDLWLPDGKSYGVGFKSGPLYGSTYAVYSISRSEQISGEGKHLIEFDLGGSSLTFADSNDIYDIEWYLTNEDTITTFENISENIPTSIIRKVNAFGADICPGNEYYFIGGSDTDRSYTHEIVGNVIRNVKTTPKRLRKVTMKFQVPTTDCVLYWYVYKSVASFSENQRRFTPIAMKVTVPESSDMAIHDSGDLNVELLPSEYYYVGVISSCPGMVVTQENSGFSPPYIERDIQVYGTGITGPSSSRNFYSVSPIFRDIFLYAYGSERRWQELCFDDDFAGDDTPSMDNVDRNGSFILGDPESNNSDELTFSQRGNVIFMNHPYTDTFQEEVSRWLTGFEMQIKANVGQKLYFSVWKRDSDNTSYYKPIWNNVVISGSSEKEWHYSGEMNIELEWKEYYILVCSARSYDNGDFTSSDATIYKTSGLGVIYAPFGTFSGIDTKYTDNFPPGYAWKTIATESRSHYNMKLHISGDSSGFTNDDPEFCLSETMLLGYDDNKTSEDNRIIYGNRFYFPEHIIYPDSWQDGVGIKNFRFKVFIPSGISSMSFYLYILNNANGTEWDWTVVWSSDPRTISKSPSQDWTGFVSASDSDIDGSRYWINPSSRSEQYALAIGWISEEVSVYRTGLRFMNAPCFRWYGQVKSESNVPPLSASTPVRFEFESSHTVVMEIDLDNGSGDTPAEIGACCFPDSSCQNLSQSQCLSTPGATWNSGTDCSSYSCVSLPTGACCLAPVRGGVIYVGPQCLDNKTEESCHGIGANATFKGVGTSCTSSTCLDGACCLSPTDCQNMSWTECMAADGIWRWPGSQCDQLYRSGSGCDEWSTGACCVKDNIDPSGCVDVDELTCSSYGDDAEAWTDSQCSKVSCTSVGTGACCYGNAGCEITTEDDCYDLHGGEFPEWQGEFTTCSDGLCPNRGICCLDDGVTCVYTTPDDCVESHPGAVYKQDGGSCSTYSCSEPRGACCLPNGICEENYTENDCNSNNGTYLGNGSTCDDSDCIIKTGIGACCLVDGSCFVGTVEECQNSIIESDYQGDGTICIGTYGVECPTQQLSGEESLLLPDHIFNDEKVATAKPSVHSAHNNNMIDRTEYTSVAYQAFENNKWNVYVRQVRSTPDEPEYSESANPLYKSPHNILERPSFEPSPLTDSIHESVVYTVVDNITTAAPENKLAAIFKVTLPDETLIVNCDEAATGTWTPDHEYAVPISRNHAYVEADYDSSVCGVGFSKWSIGSQFTGTYPPTPNALGDEGLGCITILNLFPEDVDSWCYLESSCVQSKLFDDPFCPSPYLGLTYRPEDLWTIENNGKVVTRVKYHAGINLLRLTVDTSVSGSGISGVVDFMFVVDYSSSMKPRIDAVRGAVSPFAQSLKEAGVDVRFGLCVFGRANSNENPSISPPQPPNAVLCSNDTALPDTAMFDGLYGFSTDGFTDDPANLSDAMNHWWYEAGAQAPGYSAIQFASLDSRFQWRDNAQRYIILITDTNESETLADCGAEGYPQNKSSAINVVTDSVGGTSASVLVAICDFDYDPSLHSGCSHCVACKNGMDYVDMSEASNWGSREYFPVWGPYDVAFQSILSKITTDLLQATIYERSEEGYGPTYLTPAEIIVTYDGDLSHLWTQDRHNFDFIDSPPSITGITKGLVNFPYDLSGGTVYGIEPVHLKGLWENWIYFSEPGNLQIDWPNIGIQDSTRSNAIRIAENAIKPKVLYNHRNDLFVAYETLSYGVNQIAIKGTGDFSQDSITGAKSSRLTRFYSSEEFTFEHLITLPGEGVNQLCDMVFDKNDILHITWQSNRDNRWEIYYANATDMFTPVKVTSSDSRSGHPAIETDDNGNIFIVYHDNRYGPYNVMLSYKLRERTKPLLQQDAYLASMHSGYKHYSDVLPVLINNPVIESPEPGIMWGNRERCDEVRVEIAINSSNQSGTSITENPFDRHSLTRSSIFPNEGNFVWIEIWATTTKEGGFSEMSVGFSYDSEYFGEATTLANNSAESDWHTLHHTAVIDDTSGTIDDIGGLEPDSVYGQRGYMPYWSLVGTIKLKVIKQIPANEILEFSVSSVMNPSNSSGFDIRDTYGNIFPEENISYETLMINNIDDAKQEYDCLHPSNYIFEIDENSAEIGTEDPETGINEFIYGSGDIQDYDIAAMASSTTGLFYGITNSGLLLLLAYPRDEYSGIDTSNISEIGEINIPGNYTIVDATCDTFNFNLWVMFTGTDNEGINNVILYEIDPSNASTLHQSTVYTGVDGFSGAVTCLSGGVFFMITQRDGHTTISRSEFPSMAGSTALFDFDDVQNIESAISSIGSLTSDYDDAMYLVDNGIQIHHVSQGGSVTSIGDLADPGNLLTRDSILMLSNISSLSYQFSGKTRNIAEPGFFHVLLEFYDNKNLEPPASIKIDSRENLEAFISDRTLSDEYLGDAYFGDANGLYLTPGESGYLFFDASHYVPGRDNLAYPYGFEKNQAYFIKAYSIDSSGTFSEVDDVQEVSFSCNKCSKLSNNNFDSEGCSYSFVVSNNTLTSKYYNFRVDFYADIDRNSIVKHLYLQGGHSDLQYGEVDNQPAEDKWNDNGLYIHPGESRFVQVYPALDPNAGLLCGITYYMRVLACTDETEICLEFDDTLNQGKWENQYIETDAPISDAEQTVDVAQIGENLAVCWNANGTVKYGELINGKWDIYDVGSGATLLAVSLAEINGNPGIVWTRLSGTYETMYSWRDQSGWHESTMNSNFRWGWRVKLFDWDGAPAVISYDWISGQEYTYWMRYSLDGGHSWDRENITTVTHWSGHQSVVSCAIIGGKIRALIPKQTGVDGGSDGGLWFYTRDSASSWSGHHISVNGQRTKFGEVVNYNEMPFIVFREGVQQSFTGVIQWGLSLDDGATWGQYGIVDGSENNVGKYIDLIMFNGKPAMSYSSSLSPYDLKFAREVSRLDGRWEVLTIDSGLSDSAAHDRIKSTTDYLGQVAVFPAVNPPRVYLSNPESVVSGTKPTYFCECGSSIFDNNTRSIPISEANVWKSSAYGYSDTRVSDTTGDSMRPDISVKSDGTAIVTFEDRSQSKPSIRAASFNSGTEEVFGSGTKSWYDFNPGIQGANVSSDIDINDSVSSSFERDVGATKPQSELPSHAVIISNYSYSVNDDRGANIGGLSGKVSDDLCDVSQFENNIISGDDFISGQIVRQIVVSSDDVVYFSHFNDIATPVVEKCDITIKILGTPGVVAFRLRNENESEFSDWCPWMPEVGNYITEVSHKLSLESGVKEVCVQAMTRTGITSEFCVPVIADYKKIIFEMSMYFDGDSTWENELSKHEGYYVAALTDSSGSTGTDGEEYKTIYIRIFPSERIDETSVNYDVLQQGVRDSLGMEAIENEVDGRQVFEGSFRVYKEDNVVNRDGIARVRVKLPGTCEELQETIVSSDFVRDDYNRFSMDATTNVNEEDTFESNRQNVSGRFGTDITIRPSNDPHLIFGDPNYYQKREPNDQPVIYPTEDDE